ncbi:MAG: hypothetical protein V4558_09160 [Gemmatimonadota bacterium]
MATINAGAHVRQVGGRLGTLLLLVGGVVASGCGSESAVGVSDLPATVSIVSGDGQSGLAGTVLEAPLVVKVTDLLGRPVADIGVTYSVGSPPVVNSSVETTDTDGKATARYVLGRNVGTQIVTATVAGVGRPATFTLLATPHTAN